MPKVRRLFGKLRESNAFMISFMLIEFLVIETAFVILYYYLGALTWGRLMLHFSVCLLELLCSFLWPYIACHLTWIRSIVFCILFHTNNKTYIYHLISTNGRSFVFFQDSSYTFQKRLSLVNYFIIFGAIVSNRLYQNTDGIGGEFWVSSCNLMFAFQFLFDILFIISNSAKERSFMQKVEKETIQSMERRARFIRLFSHFSKNAFSGIIPVIHDLRDDFTEHKDSGVKESYLISSAEASITQLVISNVVGYHMIIGDRVHLNAGTFNFSELVHDLEDFNTIVKTIDGSDVKVFMDDKSYPKRVYGDASMMKIIVRNIILSVSKVSKNKRLYVELHFLREKFQLRVRFVPKDYSTLLNDITKLSETKIYSREDLFMFVAMEYTKFLEGTLGARPLSGHVVLNLPLLAVEYDEFSDTEDEEDHSSDSLDFDKYKTNCKLKIMIVEDNPICSKVLEFQIHKCNQKNTIICCDGSQAYHKIRDENYQPDLIFTDYDMPIMNGLTLCHKICVKGTYLNKFCRIYMITGGTFKLSNEELRKRYNITKIFPKPTRKEIIEELINSCILRKHRLAVKKAERKKQKEEKENNSSSSDNEFGDNHLRYESFFEEIHSDYSLEDTDSDNEDDIHSSSDSDDSDDDEERKKEAASVPGFVDELLRRMVSSIYGNKVELGFGAAASGVMVYISGKLSIFTLYSFFVFTNIILSPFCEIAIKKSRNISEWMKKEVESLLPVIINSLRRVIVSLYFPSYKLLIVCDIAHVTCGFSEEYLKSLITTFFLFFLYLFFEMYPFVIGILYVDNYFKNFFNLDGTCSDNNNLDGTCFSNNTDNLGIFMFSVFDIKCLTDVGVCIYCMKYMMEMSSVFDARIQDMKEKIQKLNQENLKIKFIQSFCSTQIFKPFFILDYFGKKIGGFSTIYSKKDNSNIRILGGPNEENEENEENNRKKKIIEEEEEEEGEEDEEEVKKPKKKKKRKRSMVVIPDISDVKTIGSDYFLESILHFRTAVCNQLIPSELYHNEIFNLEKTVQKMVKEQISPYLQENTKFSFQIKFIVFNTGRTKKPKNKNGKKKKKKKEMEKKKTSYFVYFDPYILEILISNLIQTIIGNYNIIRINDRVSFENKEILISINNIYYPDTQEYAFIIEDFPGVPRGLKSSILDSRNKFIKIFSKNKRRKKRKKEKEYNFLESTFFDDDEKYERSTQNPYSYLGLFNCFKISETLLRAHDGELDWMTYLNTENKSIVFNKFIFKCKFPRVLECGDDDDENNNNNNNNNNKKRKKREDIEVFNVINDDIVTEKYLRNMYSEFGIIKKNIQFGSFRRTGKKKISVFPKKFDIFVIDFDHLDDFNFRLYKNKIIEDEENENESGRKIINILMTKNKYNNDIFSDSKKLRIKGTNIMGLKKNEFLNVFGRKKKFIFSMEKENEEVGIKRNLFFVQFKPIRPFDFERSLEYFERFL